MNGSWVPCWLLLVVFLSSGRKVRPWIFLKHSTVKEDRCVFYLNPCNRNNILMNPPLFSWYIYFRYFHSSDVLRKLSLNSDIFKMTTIS